MIIDLLQKQDINQILILEKENFDDPWPKDAFERELTNDISEFIVLKENDEVVGYAGIWYMFENADLTNICIKKEYQGKGLGEYLLKDIIKRCIRNNVEFLHLEVKVDNTKAINLYKKYGFEKVRIRNGYYNGIDGIDMVKGILGLSEEDIGD